MVIASICEHASTAFYFASISSGHICHVGSDHFRKYNSGEKRALHKFSASNNPLFISHSVITVFYKNNY